MVSETMTDIQRRIRATGSRVALCAATIWLAGCGSDGNNVTCGKGTKQKGNTCVAETPIVDGPDASSGGSDGSGGSGNSGAGGGAGASMGGSAGSAPIDSGVTEDVLVFKGVASAASGSSTPAEVAGEDPPDPDSIRLTWAAAEYPTHPFAHIHYEIFAATSSGMQNFSDPLAEAPAGSTSFLVQGLDAKNYFVVRAVSSEGNAKDTNTVEMSATPEYDDEIPTFAGGVKATKATSTSVTLTWKPGMDNLTPPAGLTYQVFWGTKSGNATTLGAVSLPGETTATVKGLPAPETEFFFRVVTVDAAGNASDDKDDFGAETSGDETAPVFGGCSATSDVTAGGATVVWTPALDDTTPADKIEYQVFAFEVPVTRDTPFDKLAPVSKFTGGTSGEIIGLKNGTSYRVVCRAFDTSGNHDENRVTQVFTTKNDGRAPTFSGPKPDPTDSIIGSTQITLAWAQAKDDQTADNKIIYYVYTATKAGDQDFTAPPLIKTIPGALGADIAGLLSNTAYFFIVRAVDEAGNVDTNTNELRLTTLVSFAADVQPIFTANCALPTCHIPGNPPQGQILQEGYAYSNIVDKVAGESVVLKEAGLKRIDSKSTNLNDSYLWRKITNTGIISGSTMPPDSVSRVLTNEQKETIKQWILQGAKEN
jgi:hypothetical protein